MNWQKYIKITAILLIIGTIIWVSYIFLKETAVFQSVSSAILGQEKQPTTIITDEKLSLISDDVIFDYWINKLNNSVYLMDEIGNIVKISSDNQKEIINTQTLNKINKIQPSYNGARIVAKFNYPAMTTFSVFDTVTRNWQPLPSNTITAAWAPNSDELAYLDDKSLNILNLVSQKTVKVMNMTQKEVNLDWISDSVMLISTVGSENSPASVWSLNLKTKAISAIINDEQGLTVKWFPNNNMGIEMRNIKRVPYTSLVDAAGSRLATFSFVTLPSKCLIETDKIYCAIPNNLKAGYILPDDYYKKAVYFNDAFYLIDIGADTASMIYNPDTESLDADHLEILSDLLLFKSRLNNKLYGLKME